MIPGITIVKFNNKDYRVKYFLKEETLEQFIFATEELANDLVANNGRDAKALDKKIAFYFPINDFRSGNAIDLYNSQNGVFNKTITL